MNAIEVSHISKSYGEVKALTDVSFTVGKGEVFGLIGQTQAWISAHPRLDLKSASTLFSS